MAMASSTASASGTAVAQPSASDAPVCLPHVAPLDNSIGAYLIGTFVGLVLYGFLLHQVIAYFRLYPKDHLLLKALVSCVLLLETVGAVLNTHVCYFYLVQNYAQPEQLLNSVWSLSLSPIVLASTIAASQVFFVRRVYLIGRRYRFLAIIALLIIVTIAFDIAATVVGLQVKAFTEITRVGWLIAVGSMSIIAGDICLTLALILTLRQSRTGLKSTDSLIHVIVIYTINTGLLNGTLTLLLFVLNVALPPGNLIFAGLGIVTVRVYANAFLTTLNSRITLAKRGMFTFGVVGTDFPPGTSTTARRDARLGTGTRMEFATPGGTSAVELDSWIPCQSSSAATLSAGSRGAVDIKINVDRELVVSE
ncbi:hypothetical protein C8Q80DRAFT_203312 [Daedaleopsis nitida]|nr:hypothetical protein C8Q80DRAFT_203312 [Daedaleopsis nitida]